MMDIGEYVQVFRRRWLIVAFVVGVALAAAAVLSVRGPRSFEAVTRMAVSVAVDSAPTGLPVGDPRANPQAQSPSGANARAGEAAPYTYTRDYYNWLASEYLADDLSEIMKSDSFAEDVRLLLNEEIDRGTIREVVRTRKTHRILEVTIQASSADRAKRIAAGIAEVVRTKGGKYLAQLSSPSAQITVIDEPVVKVATTTGSQAADIALRGLLGLMAGLFLAVIVDYVDSATRVRSAKAVEQALSLPVLGEIPSA